MRIGVMGFGGIGRQIYALATRDAGFEVVAVSDVGRADILHDLLCHELRRDGDEAPSVSLEGNYLVHPRFSTRMMSADRPSEIPWDVFDVDLVIDATGAYRTRESVQPHLDNGAPRVLISKLPDGAVDRVVVCGVNDHEARSTDRIVSAASATTTAMALMLKTISDSHGIEHATMTSVHAYTSDQSLQDYAGPDYRRSRSGAENIIPNASPAPAWVEHLLPALKGKVTGYALNVPVRVGSLLDLTVAFKSPDVDANVVNALMSSAALANPRAIATIADPIVSSDVKGSSVSVLFDLSATMKAATRLVKMLIWHETLGHARHILDVARVYATLDSEKRT